MLADEGETGPELDEELLDVLQQPFLKGAFLGVLGEGEKLEVVRVFQRLPGQVGLRGREGLLEIGLGLALPLVEIALDPVDEDGPAPAVFDRLARGTRAVRLGVLSLSSRTQLWNQGICAAACCTIASSGQARGESPHVFEVARREAGHVREGTVQVGGQPVDDLGLPSPRDPGG